MAEALNELGVYQINGVDGWALRDPQLFEAARCCALFRLLATSERDRRGGLAHLRQLTLHVGAPVLGAKGTPGFLPPGL